MSGLSNALPYPRNRKTYFIYILCSGKNGTLYIGMTDDLYARLKEHKAKTDTKSFTARYDVNRLVYFEAFDYVNDAIAREKRLKKYKRDWKINLIEVGNPNWEELSLDALDLT